MNRFIPILLLAVILLHFHPLSQETCAEDASRDILSNEKVKSMHDKEREDNVARRRSQSKQHKGSLNKKQSRIDRIKENLISAKAHMGSENNKDTYQEANDKIDKILTGKSNDKTVTIKDLEELEKLPFKYFKTDSDNIILVEKLNFLCKKIEKIGTLDFKANIEFPKLKKNEGDDYDYKCNGENFEDHSVSPFAKTATLEDLRTALEELKRNERKAIRKKEIETIDANNSPKLSIYKILLDSLNKVAEKGSKGIDLTNIKLGNDSLQSNNEFKGHLKTLITNLEAINDLLDKIKNSISKDELLSEFIENQKNSINELLKKENHSEKLKSLKKELKEVNASINKNQSLSNEQKTKLLSLMSSLSATIEGIHNPKNLKKPNDALQMIGEYKDKLDSTIPKEDKTNKTIRNLLSDVHLEIINLHEEIGKKITDHTETLDAANTIKKRVINAEEALNELFKLHRENNLEAFDDHFSEINKKLDKLSEALYAEFPEIRKNKIKTFIKNLDEIHNISSLKAKDEIAFAMNELSYTPSGDDTEKDCKWSSPQAETNCRAFMDLRTAVEYISNNDFSDSFARLELRFRYTFEEFWDKEININETRDWFPGRLHIWVNGALTSRNTNLKSGTGEVTSEKVVEGKLGLQFDVLDFYKKDDTKYFPEASLALLVEGGFFDPTNDPNNDFTKLTANHFAGLRLYYRGGMAINGLSIDAGWGVSEFFENQDPRLKVRVYIPYRVSFKNSPAYFKVFGAIETDVGKDVDELKLILGLSLPTDQVARGIFSIFTGNVDDSK